MRNHTTFSIMSQLQFMRNLQHKNLAQVQLNIQLGTMFMKNQLSHYSITTNTLMNTFLLRTTTLTLTTSITVNLPMNSRTMSLHQFSGIATMNNQLLISITMTRKLVTTIMLLSQLHITVTLSSMNQLKSTIHMNPHQLYGPTITSSHKLIFTIMINPLNNSTMNQSHLHMKAISSIMNLQMSSTLMSHPQSNGTVIMNNHLFLFTIMIHTPTPIITLKNLVHTLATLSSMKPTQEYYSYEPTPAVWSNYYEEPETQLYYYDEPTQLFYSEEEPSPYESYF